MDFDQLTTFIEIAKLGSFSRAGQKLFRSQPAVSAQVRQLEQEYGEKLFDRGRKSVRLTSAGETLFEYAVRMVNMRGESLRAVADKATTPRGVLALGATSSIAQATLRLLAERHASFFLVGRNAQKLAAVRDDLLTRGATAVTNFVADLDDTAAHPAMLSHAATALGGIDLAFLAHGVLGDQPAAEQSAAASVPVVVREVFGW